LKRFDHRLHVRWRFLDRAVERRVDALDAVALVVHFAAVIEDRRALRCVLELQRV
jgi:hypothetical protein